MADTIYHNFFASLMQGGVDYHGAGSNTINVALYTDSYSIDPDETTYGTTNEHANSGNYTQGGVALTAANNAVADDDANNWATLDNSDDPTWSTATITAAFAKLYNATVSNLLICCFDFGGNKSSTAGTFKITFNASGILKIA
jgi:hypothetical protein